MNYVFYLHASIICRTHALRKHITLPVPVKSVPLYIYYNVKIDSMHVHCGISFPLWSPELTSNALSTSSLPLAYIELRWTFPDTHNSTSRSYKAKTFAGPPQNKLVHAAFNASSISMQLLADYWLAQSCMTSIMDICKHLGETDITRIIST